MAGKSEGVSRFLGSLQFTEQLGKNMPALSRARPDLVRGIEAGDQEAMLEAYRWIVSQGDRVTSPKGMRSLRKVDPESARQVEAWRAGDEEYIPVGEMAAKLDAPPQQYGRAPAADAKRLSRAHESMRSGWPTSYDASPDEVMDPSVFRDFGQPQQRLLQELSKNDWLGFDYPSQAVSAVFSKDAGNFDMSPALIEARDALLAGGSPPRQLELPMRSPEDEIRALIPATRSGSGVPVGSPYGGPSTDMIPAPLRGLPAPGGMVPSQRAMTPAQGEIAAQFDRALSTDVDLPGLPGPRPRYRVWQDPPRRLEGEVDNGLPRIRVIDAEPPRRGFNWKPAAAAAAAGGGLYVATQRDDDEPALTSTAGTADLKAETSPPPAVATEEEPPVREPAAPVRDAREPAAPVMGPRERAHAMIKQLNDMRRAAGGEVPQAKAMMAEINRLLADSNQQRNAPGFDPQPRTDPHNQALRLTQELNDMRRRAGGEVPQAQAMMREIARLNAMGDQMVNNRTAGRRVG